MGNCEYRLQFSLPALSRRNTVPEIISEAGRERGALTLGTCTRCVEIATRLARKAQGLA